MEYLEELFTLYDEIYFNNEITKLKQYFTLTFKWLPVSIQSTGRFIIHGNTATIAVSERCRGSEELLLHTLVHEMVHAKQRLYFTITGDEKYLDKKRLSKKSLWQNKGHGHYFLTWANELNAKFHELNIQVKDEMTSGTDFTLEKTSYVAVVNFRGGRARLFMSEKPILNLEQLYYQAQELFGHNSVSSVCTYHSRSSVIGFMTSLTNSGLIPSNIKLATNLEEHVSKFLNHETTNELSEFSIEIDYKDNISKSFQDTLIDPKYTLISYASFSDFIYYIVVNHTEWNASKIESGIDIITGKHSNLIPKHYVEHAYRYWVSCANHRMVKHLHNRTHQKAVNGMLRNNDIESLAHFLTSISLHCGSKRLPVDKVCEHVMGIHLKPSNAREHNVIKELFHMAQKTAMQNFKSLETIVKQNPDWITMSDQEFHDHLVNQAVNSGYKLKSAEFTNCLKVKEGISTEDVISSNKAQGFVNAILNELNRFLGAKTKTAQSQYRKNTCRKIKDCALQLDIFNDPLGMQTLLWNRCLTAVEEQSPPNYKQQIVRRIETELNFKPS
ncbi:SprT-like domain-containing protein [Vibrio owensii]|uniref:SprT-like domain-containing protein n=1 Tax=Vibrio owensii TaxID=696485 RepID=UPI003CC5801F